MSLVQADRTPYQATQVVPHVVVADRILSRIAKRVFDVAIAGTALVALSPVLLVAAVAVKSTSKGPVIFRQARYGKDREVFGCLKFRTMTVCEAPTEFVQCRKGDTRVTRVGRVLRKTSVDELPQLLNVIGGSMSLVGPRPHPTKLDDQFAPLLEGYEGRFRVKPGITGLAQIRGHRGPTETAEAMRGRILADVEYARTRSLSLDLSILARTLPAVLAGQNAF